MALFKRKFAKHVVMHTDRGSQYYSKKYRTIIKNNKLIRSMSRKGNCWDNAIAENFFHTLKTELIHVSRYIIRADARKSIFQCIEGYYNQKKECIQLLTTEHQLRLNLQCKLQRKVSTKTREDPTKAEDRLRMISELQLRLKAKWFMLEPGY